MEWVWAKQGAEVQEARPAVWNVWQRAAATNDDQHPHPNPTTPLSFAHLPALQQPGRLAAWQPAAQRWQALCRPALHERHLAAADGHVDGRQQRAQVVQRQPPAQLPLRVQQRQRVHVVQVAAPPARLPRRPRQRVQQAARPLQRHAQHAVPYHGHQHQQLLQLRGCQRCCRRKGAAAMQRHAVPQVLGGAALGVVLIGVRGRLRLGLHGQQVLQHEGLGAHVLLRAGGLWGCLLRCLPGGPLRRQQRRRQGQRVLLHAHQRLVGGAQRRQLGQQVGAVLHKGPGGSLHLDGEKLRVVGGAGGRGRLEKGQDQKAVHKCQLDHDDVLSAIRLTSKELLSPGQWHCHGRAWALRLRATPRQALAPLPSSASASSGPASCRMRSLSSCMAACGQQLWGMGQQRA